MKWDENIRYIYDLNENSNVIDAGGFKGTFSENIAKKFNCNIFIFEPVNMYYDLLCKKFKDNKKIKIYNLGLSDRNHEELIYIKGIFGESSIYQKVSNETQTIKLIDVHEFIKNNNINNVDLFKINIEGGEYSLLNHMIKNNTHKICENMQIQFHDFIENSTQMRNEIRKNLEKTHFLTYDFEFIWENWKKNVKSEL